MIIDSSILQSFAYEIIKAKGSSAEEAETVAKHLVMANLTGHDSHGVGMLPTYVKSIDSGALFPDVILEKTLDSGSMLQFNAKRGYGQRMAKEAMEQAVERCGETGLVLMGLGNSHHIGRVGSYGEQAMRAGYISIHFVNVVDHRPMVAPFRGTDARYSTNPVCIAVPESDSHPSLLLDMATSKVALGKVRVAMNKGEQMADGVLFDGEGKPTNDPSVMFSERIGAITALGDHKGYGIALMCEILAGGLTSGYTIQPGNERMNGIVNNMLTIIIDPVRMTDNSLLHNEISKLIEYVKKSPAIKSDEPVLIPGDPERAAFEDRSKNGITVDDTTWGQLKEIADNLKIQIPQTKK